MKRGIFFVYCQFRVFSAIINTVRQKRRSSICQMSFTIKQIEIRCSKFNELFSFFFLSISQCISLPSKRPQTICCEIESSSKIRCTENMEPATQEKPTIELEMVNQTGSSLETTHFMDLNDDSIMTILEYLPLEDLNRMSLVCKRIYQLSDSVYHREHLDCLKIQVNENLKLIFHDHYFPRRFSSEVPNLCIFCTPTNNLFEFIKANCCPNLKRIEFSGRIEQLNGEIIEDQLSSVEYLCLAFALSEECDIYESLLQFCGNLKHLKIRITDVDPPMNVNWLTKIYPKLTRLDIPTLQRPTSGELLKQFMEQHPQLETITCSGQLIKTMLPNLPKFKRLLIYGYHEHIPDDLEPFCDNGTIEWLEIESYLNYQILSGLAKLKSLRTINKLFSQDEDPEESSPLQRMTQLREMNLDFAGDKSIEIASKLPELVKITINLRNTTTFMNSKKINELLMKFAENSKKLKILELQSRTSDHKITFEELLKIDLVRSMVPEAVKMSIIFNMMGSFNINLHPFEGKNLGDLKFIRAKVIP